MSETRTQSDFVAGRSEPLISIIMSVYNCESTLEEAVESIFAQTYSNWELIICDDASTDGTPAVLRRLAQSDTSGRVSILRNEDNRRLAHSLNRCLEVASGVFIARMDGDDISEPFRLERQLRFLQTHPEFDLVGSAMRRFNSDGAGEVIYPASAEPDRWSMARSSRAPFFHATILARRSVFDSVGNYTVAWRTNRGQDYDLWFKFFAAGLRGWNIPEPLYRVREDAAAIRRRTATVRLGGYATFIKGARSLGYPPHFYIRPTVNLLKIFVPYRVFDWHRQRSREIATTPKRRGIRAQ